jgi:hypothetical protein
MFKGKDIYFVLLSSYLLARIQNDAETMAGSQAA